MPKQEGKLIGYNLETNNGLKFKFGANEKDKMRKVADKNGGGSWCEIREYTCEECGDITNSIYSCRKEQMSIRTSLDSKFVCKKCFDKIDSENKLFNGSVFKKQDEIMDDIKENGIDVCRINFHYYGDERNEQDVLTEIGNYMIDNGMYHLNTGHYYGVRIRQFSWGNGCLCHVPVEFADKIKEKFPFVELDLYLHHIGRKELKELNKGDRVEVASQSILGENKNKFTVYMITDDEIVVCKTARSSKGYKYRVGDCVAIKKVA